MLKLERFSFGVGDRFAHQAKAQLKAFTQLAENGVVVAPVWNKSNREHTFIGSHPDSVRAAASAAINQLKWPHPWHVDADHIRLQTVDRFLDSSDFFTIDVADSIGDSPSRADVTAFIQAHPELLGSLEVPGIPEKIEITREFLAKTAAKYLVAAKEAGTIYRHISSKKFGDSNFIAEVSMDETDQAQSPSELLIILALLSDAKVHLQTIAPKFTGRFNKGVDYVGNLARFDKEFRDDLAVIRFAIGLYNLPSNLKLSVHSGSDKFSLYPLIRKAIEDTGAGLHLKTAGTTWLEELIGLAEAGGDGLAMAKEFYYYALAHVDELCAPYASVIEIDRAKLPPLGLVESWDGQTFAATLRHVQSEPKFNAHIRQLLHVSFKLAAQKGELYLDLLRTHEAIVGKQVTENIYQRHMVPLFLG